MVCVSMMDTQTVFLLRSSCCFDLTMMFFGWMVCRLGGRLDAGWLVCQLSLSVKIKKHR